MKTFVRVCKNCGEGLIVSTGDANVTCTHCNTHHTVDWVPKIEKGNRWLK